MKKAKKILNSFVDCVDKNDKQYYVAKTVIFYDDGTSEDIYTFNGENEEWSRLLANKISNYDDFMNNSDEWLKNGQYEEDVSAVKYIDFSDVKNCVRSDAKKIQFYKDDRSNIAYGGIMFNDGTVDKFFCPSDEVDDILREVVENYDELENNSKVNIEEVYNDDYSSEYIDEDNVLSIDFLVGNNFDEDHAEIVYENDNHVTRKTVSVENAEKIIQNMDNEDNNISYQDVNGEIIDMETFYNIYNKHVKEREESFQNEEISRIVFYKPTDGKTEKAVIFRSNGTYITVDRTQAINEAIKYADQNNINKDNYDELVTNGFFEYTTEEKLINNLSEYIKKAKKDVKYKNQDNKDNDNKNTNKAKKKKGFLKKIFSKIKNSKTIKKVLAVATAVAGLITGVALFSKKSDKPSNDINPSSSQVQKDKKNIKSDSNYKSINYTNSYDILNALRDNNATRYNYLDSIKNALYNYNVEDANKFLEVDKNTQLAHTFDECGIKYLLYNNIDGEDITNIFGNVTIDKDKMMNSFISGISQDGLAHNIQSSNLKNDVLFNTQEGKDFYNKYNGLFTKMNNCELAKDKKICMKQFYNMVRNDFPEMKTNSYDNVEGYKFSVLEYISAIENMNINVSNKLNDSEKNYFIDLKNNVVNSKINDIVKIQNARVIVDDSFNEKDMLPDVEAYSKIFTSELHESGNDYVSDEKRDITNYDSYKLNIKGLSKDKKGINNNVNKEIDKDISYANNDVTNGDTNSNSTTNYYSAGDTGNINNNSNEDVTINLDDMPSDSNNSDNNYSNEEITIYLEDIPSDSNNSDNNNQDTVVDNNNDNNHNTVSLDDFISGGDNYDNINESNNDVGAVTPDTPLPDPNKENTNTSSMSSMSNEQLADMIVENWANTSSIEEGNQYTLHL